MFRLTKILGAIFFLTLANSNINALELIINAKAGFVDTKLYLEPGDTVEISASGQWSAQPDLFNNAEGFSSYLINGCPAYSLIGTQSLGLKPKISCIGIYHKFIAKDKGYLFLGVNDSQYGDNRGYLKLDIKTNKKQIPPVSVQNLTLPTLDRESLIRLDSDHFHIYLPKSYVAKRKENIQKSLLYFDLIYSIQMKLTGRIPFNGHKIRLFPGDIHFHNIGALMIAGNPIYYHQDMLSLNSPYELLEIYNPRKDSWGIIHEIAHNFTMNKRLTELFIGRGAAEAWANIVNLYSLNLLNRKEYTQENDMCIASTAYKVSGNYSELLEYNNLYFCMLIEIKNKFGWKIFESFFKKTQSIKDGNINLTNDKNKWLNIIRLLSQDMAIQQEIKQIFRSYKISLGAQ